MSESEPNPPPKTTHRRVLLMGGMSLEQQTRTSNELGSTLLADYEGNMSLWNVPLEYLAAFKRFFAGGWREMEDVIHLNGASFNPLEGEPTFPANLTQQRSEDYQLWLFHMVGLAKNEWWQQLREANITVTGHMSNEAYRVWVNGEQLRKLEAMVNSTNFVRWTGPYHPYYKIDHDLRPFLTAPQANPEHQLEISVTFFKHENVQDSINKLQNMGGKVLFKFAHGNANDISIVLPLAISHLVTIANWPDVMFITTWDSPVVWDENGPF